MTGIHRTVGGCLTGISRSRADDPPTAEHAATRVYGPLADYEDQNDHDTLRSDPVFKLIADRSPDDPQELAWQRTFSRFENSAAIADVWRLRDVLVEQSSSPRSSHRPCRDKTGVTAVETQQPHFSASRPITGLQWFIYPSNS